VSGPDRVILLAFNRISFGSEFLSQPSQLLLCSEFETLFRKRQAPIGQVSKVNRGINVGH
jgi:hypothetical protein